MDASVLIDAANGPYKFDLAPGYWKALDAHLANGDICAPEMVYKELVGFGDELSKWMKLRKQKGVCKPADKAIQETYGKVADSITTALKSDGKAKRYESAEIADFLSGADAWLIAHAIQQGGTVVTVETDAKPLAKKVRIPDVCQALGVKVINGYAMLAELKIVI